MEHRIPSSYRRIPSTRRYKRKHFIEPLDDYSDSEIDIQEGCGHCDNSPRPWFRYLVGFLFWFLVILILNRPGSNMPPKESHDSRPGTEMTTATVKTAHTLAGTVATTTPTSLTAPILRSLQPPSTNDKSPDSITQKRQSATKRPPESTVEGGSQSFVLNDLVAWISYLPSLCYHPKHWQKLPHQLNRIPGRELGLFGAAHLAPDPTAERGNPECVRTVERAASRQRALFDPKLKPSWTSLFAPRSRMSDPQMQIVRQMIDAAEESAKFACMTDREMKGWAKEEAKRLDEEMAKRREIRGSSWWPAFMRWY